MYREARGEKMGRRGFTLVELLVVLAVSSILLTIAIPGYAFLANTNRLAAVTNDLVSALQMARSEAIKRGMPVTVCKTGNATASAPTCDITASWQHGWLVFVDAGTKGVIDSGDILLWTRERVSNDVIITTSNFSRFVSYLPGGSSQGPNGLANGALHVCVAGNQRSIIINTIGRPRLSSSTC